MVEGGALNIICIVLLLGMVTFYVSLCCIGKRYMDEKHAHQH